MTRAPRLSERMRALNEAAEIAEARAAECTERWVRLARERPDDKPGASAEFVAAIEAKVIARLIRERMQNRRAKP
jgi:hypothetical protein